MMIRGILLTSVAFVFAGCERAPENEVPVEQEAVLEAEMIAPDAPDPVPEEVARSGDALDDDIAYSYQLAMLGGQMRAYIELYRIGEFAAATTHLNAASDTIYTNLIDPIAARDKAGLVGEFASLKQQNETRGDVQGAFETFITGLRGHTVGLSTKLRLIVISEMIETSADYFAASVDEDGVITDKTGYQNAYGVVVTAREILSRIDTDDINVSDAIAVTHEQLDMVELAFPSLMATQSDGDPVSIKRAAKQIDQIAIRLI